MGINRPLSKAHQELIEIVTKPIISRQIFEAQVKDIYLRFVFREKYDSDVIGEQMDHVKLERKSKQWLGNAISLLVLRGYLGLVVKNKENEIEYRQKARLG